MVMSINPCDQCPVFIMCADMCHAKINYGTSINIAVAKSIKRTHGFNILDYHRLKRLQLSHREEMYLIEDRMRKRNQNNRT